MSAPNTKKDPLSGDSGQCEGAGFLNVFHRLIPYSSDAMLLLIFDPQQKSFGSFQHSQSPMYM